MTLETLLDRARRWPRLALVALCLVLWLPGFFSLPPGDRDESRFAQATKQMLETGNFIRIQNGTVPRNQKPIGIYWMQAPFAAAARAAGVGRGNPIWPYRLPSLLGGLVAVLATYQIGLRMGGRRVALLAGALLAGSAILTVETHIAKTDAALLGAITIAMAIVARAFLDPEPLRMRYALLFWVALVAGILLKGPVCLMVVGLTLLALFVSHRRRNMVWLRGLRPGLGIPLVLVLVLPWFVAIALATHGQFFNQSVGGDLANKLAGSDDAHGAPFGLHAALMPLLLWGGGVAVLCALPSLWRDRAVPAVRFLLAWIVPSWLVFEIVATKLPHYTLPMYPALALLAARWVLSPGGRRQPVSATVGMVVVSVAGVAALALPEIAAPGLHAADLLGVPAFLVAVLLLWRLFRVWPDGRQACLAMFCAAPFFYAGVFGVEFANLTALWIAPRLCAAAAAHGGRFATLGFAEPSVMFLCGTDTQLFSRPAEAAAFLASDRRNLLAVESHEPLQTALPQIGEIEGYNYSRGKQVELIIRGTPNPN